MNLEEPLLDNTSGGDQRRHSGEESGLPSWLDPVNDEDHRSLMSGISGSGDGNQNSTLWADEPSNSPSPRGNRPDLPRLILGVRIINIAAAIALITCSVRWALLLNRKVGWNIFLLWTEYTLFKRSGKLHE